MKSGGSPATATGGRHATTRHIPPKLALAVGMPVTPAPIGWQWVALTDVARLESGHTPSRRHPEYWGGKIPWICLQDAKANHGARILDTMEQTNELGIANSSARVLPKDTVCLSRTASVGYVTVMGSPMATSQDFVNWVCSDMVDPNFLKYLFIAEGKDILRFSSGAVHQTIYFPEAKAFHVALPSISEQRRIVAILDEAFACIATAKANAEKNRGNAISLYESQSQLVFSQRGKGWEEKTLGDVCEISSILVDPRRKEFLDLLHVGGANIVAKKGELIELKTAREERLISGKFVFDDSMVLYSKIRPYLMKVARPEFKGLCSADIYPLSPMVALLERDYLFHMLLSKKFTDYANQGSARAGMPKVNREHLFSFRTYMPSVTKQKEYASMLNEVQNESVHLEVIYRQKLDALDALKKSLLHQAFSGEL